MSLEDRKYMRESELREPAPFRLPGTALGWLMLVNVVVFVLQHVCGLFLTDPGAGDYRPVPLGGFSVQEFREGDTWWARLTPFTYQFVHEGFAHLFFNLFFIWLAGRVLQQFLGNRAMLLLYLGSGLFGLALHFVARELPIMLRDDSAFGGASYLVGASGSAVGIVVALALFRPYADLFEPFHSVLPLRLSARNLALGIILVTGGFILVDWLRGVGGRSPLMPVAHHVHLGGASFGALFGWLFRKWEPAQLRKQSIARATTESRHKTRVGAVGGESPLPPISIDDEHLAAAVAEEEAAEPVEPGDFVRSRIDPILDKINDHGYDSLSDEEKRILEEGRRRL